MAQRFGHNPSSKLDSIHVKGDRFIFIDDHAYYVRKDTVFLLPDSVEFHIRKNNMDRTDSFYKNVEAKMSKRKASSLMYDLLFKSDSHHKPHNHEAIGQRFIPYENETIDKINYKYLKVFGSKINDTTVNRENKWTKPVNKIHVHTRKWVVRKNLQFKEKDRIRADAMVNSERLLRRLDYIKDARVFIDDTKNNKHADVVVVTKDVFPYNFLWRPNNGNDALFGISNINIAGIGHELEYDNIDNGGSEFYYRIRNIENTFIDSEINYSNHFRKTGTGLFLSKDFLTEETKYAGGFSYSRYKFGELNYDYVSEIYDTLSYELKYRDLWVAKTFNTSIVSNVLGFGEDTKVVVSARVEHFDFINRPRTNASTNFRFHNKNNYLFSLGLTSRTYYKDRFILQYGRTEDIPTGTRLWVVLGHQSGEYRNRKYLGFNYARGGYIENFGYLNTIYSLGSFINKDGFSDGVLKIGADYYTKLFSLNQFKFRQFVNLSFSQTIRPDDEAILRSQNDLGIRGVSSFYLLTTTRLNVSMESLLFTPVDIIGFKLAVFGFLDYTITSNNRNDFFGAEQSLGLGGGIRLRNDNLAFSTIQLRIGFYPKTPANSSFELLDFATSTRLDIRDFFFKAPEVLQFK